MIKKIFILMVFSIQIFADNNFYLGDNNFKVENIEIYVDKNIVLSEKEKAFPLDIKGKYVERFYTIMNKKELRQSILDFSTVEFKKVTINCIYRESSTIEKDLTFISRLYKDRTINNKIIFITPNERIEFTTSQFLKEPFVLIEDFFINDLIDIDNKKDIERTFNIYKNKWDQMELSSNKKILTNMFINKMLYSDHVLYKEIVNNENIPKFLSSMIGSEYCDIQLNSNKVITNKNCNISLYNYKGLSKNTLFVNGFYYMGVILNKEETIDNYIYTMDNSQELKNNVYKYNMNYSQLNLNYFTNIINIKMTSKDQFNKYFLNSKENEKFDKDRNMKLRKFLSNKKVHSSTQLFKEMEKKMNDDIFKEYHR